MKRLWAINPISAAEVDCVEQSLTLHVGAGQVFLSGQAELSALRDALDWALGQPVRLNSTKTVAVSPRYLWAAAGDGTPRGAKLLVINRAAGVATFGQWSPGSWWTHWAPLPVFKEPTR